MKCLIKCTERRWEICQSSFCGTSMKNLHLRQHAIVMNVQPEADTNSKAPLCRKYVCAKIYIDIHRLIKNNLQTKRMLYTYQYHATHTELTHFRHNTQTLLTGRLQSHIGHRLHTSHAHIGYMLPTPCTVDICTLDTYCTQLLTD